MYATCTGRGGQPRKPLELAGKPAARQRLASMLTTHPGLSGQQGAGLLRSHWTEETFFHYLRAEFGLDTLPEHALEELDADAWVVKPAWRTIDKALRKERNRVGRLRRKRASERDPKGAAAQRAGRASRLATARSRAWCGRDRRPTSTNRRAISSPP